MIHAYWRSNGGSLTHHLHSGEDYGGTITVTGEKIELKGWPTPYMRPAVDGGGWVQGWFVGTDEHGNIARKD